MQPEANQYLYDIGRALERLTRYSAGKTQADYLVDDLLRSAVERQFITIGEALSRLLQDVWRILENHLPILRHEIDILLKAAGPVSEVP